MSEGAWRGASGAGTPGIRQRIRAEVQAIVPGDREGLDTQRDVLAWVDSEAELCRLDKPATPPRHLVSYFVVLDGVHLLLVDHINAMLWLPTGGHVEPGEHPRETVLREAREELAMEAQFLAPGPHFITSTVTSGRTTEHTDVSLWYVLRGDRRRQAWFDATEFHSIRWFHRREVPLDRSDPHMGRFLAKFFGRERS